MQTDEATSPVHPFDDIAYRFGFRYSTKPGGTETQPTVHDVTTDETSSRGTGVASSREA